MTKRQLKRLIKECITEIQQNDMNEVNWKALGLAGAMALSPMAGQGAAGVGPPRNPGESISAYKNRTGHIYPAAPRGVVPSGVNLGGHPSAPPKTVDKTKNADPRAIKFPNGSVRYFGVDQLKVVRGMVRENNNNTLLIATSGHWVTKPLGRGSSTTSYEIYTSATVANVPFAGELKSGDTISLLAIPIAGGKGTNSMFLYGIPYKLGTAPPQL